MAIWLWYIHIVDYYSTAKRNELLTHKTWMDFKEIMLNEKKTILKSLYTLRFHLFDSLEIM